MVLAVSYDTTEFNRAAFLNKNRRRPVRWRSGLEIEIVRWSVLSPYEGDSSCGSNAGVGKAFLWRLYRRFFAPSKKWGYKFFQTKAGEHMGSPLRIKPPFSKES